MAIEITLVFKLRFCHPDRALPGEGSTDGVVWGKAIGVLSSLECSSILAEIDFEGGDEGNDLYPDYDGQYDYGNSDAYDYEESIY